MVENCQKKMTKYTPEWPEMAPNSSKCSPNAANRPPKTQIILYEMIENGPTLEKSHVFYSACFSHFLCACLGSLFYTSPPPPAMPASNLPGKGRSVCRGSAAALLLNAETLASAVGLGVSVRPGRHPAPLRGPRSRGAITGSVPSGTLAPLSLGQPQPLV